MGRVPLRPPLTPHRRPRRPRPSTPLRCRRRRARRRRTLPHPRTATFARESTHSLYDNVHDGGVITELAVHATGRDGVGRGVARPDGRRAVGVGAQVHRRGGVQLNRWPRGAGAGTTRAGLVAGRLGGRAKHPWQVFPAGRARQQGCPLRMGGTRVA